MSHKRYTCIVIMKCIVLLLCATTIWGIPVKEPRKRYDGYKILEINPQNKAQDHYVRSLQSDNELDFWSYVQPWLVMVAPHRLYDVYMKLAANDIPYTIVRDNVQEQLQAEQERFDSRDPEIYQFDYDDYNRLEDILAEMDAIASRCSEGFNCYTFSAGISVEGNEIRVLKIEKEGEEGRKTIWLDSMCHAREWLPGTTVLHIANRLGSDYGTDSVVQWLLDSYDWYIMPIMNPDGYIYTWDVDRYWRKNRSPNDGGCMGVDLNRNFDEHWGSDGASSNPCTNTYMGPSAASEPETQVVQAELDRLGADIDGMISYHAQGQMWLHSWGWTVLGQCARSDHHDELYRVASAAADAVQATHDTTWTRGTICETIYAASGGTVEYAHGPAGIIYAYTPELRGPGHDPPATEIQPSYEENWNGLVAMIDAIQNP